MFKNVIRAGSVFASTVPFYMTDHDVPKEGTKTAAAFHTRPANLESGKDRLYSMFSVDEFGSMSSEINSIYQSAFMGFLTGAVWGGFIQSRAAYVEFMENNQATAFKSHLDAKKKLQDQVTINFAKGAIKWGWRLALFTSTYVGIVTTISVYRGKSSIYEYVAAGAVAGAMYKVNTGLRGMTVGGLLGIGLGGVAGAISLVVLKFSGTSMEEVRYWQYNWKKDRDQSITAAELKNSLSERDPLLDAHGEAISVKDHSLQTIKVEKEVKSDKK